jgi:mercuric ion transport protein
MKVELIYDAECPNVAATRSVLIDAFTRTGTSARWREWVNGAPHTPPYVSGYGSPTILVDGKDVAGASPRAGSSSCRLYAGQDGTLSRTPVVEAVCSALLAADKPAKQRGMFRAFVASFPAIGTALLPKLTCPLCWPAYSAALSALGLGFVDYTPYLLPATLAFLAIAVGALAIAARRTRRLMPLVLGLAASGAVSVGKFAVDSAWITNTGIALLVVAIFLAARARTVRSASCPACAPAGSEPQTRARRRFRYGSHAKD